MSLYVGGKKYNITMAKWRGFWSVTIYGFPGTIIDCGSQKVIGDDGKVTFKFAESDTYTFIAMRGDKTEVLEVDLVDGEYFVERNMYVGVTLLEYLESTGTQYIDTGLFLNQDSKIEVEWSTELAVSQYLYGTSTTNPRITLYLTTKTEGRGNQRFGNTTVDIDASNYADGQKHKTIQSKEAISFDSIDYSYTNVGTFTILQSFTLFKNVYSTAVGAFVGKVYSMKIYNNNELIGDFVPSKDTDGVVCMFDLVTEQFFYNAGTGEFIAGPIKE